jgi:hypothetical protein
MLWLHSMEWYAEWWLGKDLKGTNHEQGHYGGVLKRPPWTRGNVKEPQAPRGPLSKITGYYPSKYIVSNSSNIWFRRSMVGGASGTIALREYGGWFEIQRGCTIDHIEVAVHEETHPWKPYDTIAASSCRLWGKRRTSYKAAECAHYKQNQAVHST